MTIIDVATLKYDEGRDVYTFGVAGSYVRELAGAWSAPARLLITEQEFVVAFLDSSERCICGGTIIDTANLRLGASR